MKERALPMSGEALVAHGFRAFPITRHDAHDAHWQFCIRDERGKKLFVQVRFWDHPQHDAIFPPSLDAWCALRAGGKDFRLELIDVSGMTPAQVVAWFEAAHGRLGCDYYEDA